MKTLARLAWIPAILASLSISTFSLYWIGRTWGLPVPLAVMVSTVFDGSALTFADLALRYARTHGDSGLAPRIAVLALAGVSAWLNSWHAVLSGDPMPAQVLYAAPPIVSIALFDIHTRWERRAALRRAGRVPASLPVFGRYAWLLFPAKTLSILRAIVAYRLETIMKDNDIAAERQDQPQAPVLSSANPATVRLWARKHGLNVGATGRIPREVMTAYEREAGTNRLKAVPQA